MRSDFSLPDVTIGKNAIIFRVDVSSVVHVDNRKKGILIISKGSTQGLNDTTLTAQAQYSINFFRIK